MPVPDAIKLEARKELARRDLWEFEKLLYPEIFSDKSWLLRELAKRTQAFYERSPKHFMVISLPPGHFKSFTVKNLSLWVLGRNNRCRIIAASNTSMAETFSTQVRDTILGKNFGVGGVPYPQIFPKTKIKQGYATKARWEIEGAPEPTYRMVTPGSSVTGSRSDLFLFDDIIKNHIDALNSRVLKEHWDWFNNTIFSRADGESYKFIFIMQRWATKDLAGCVMERYGDQVEAISFPAINGRGEMLDPQIMSREKLEMLRQALSPEVFSANYLQQPIDVKNRLYGELQEYQALPEGDGKAVRKAYVDTADTGSDYFCALLYVNIDGKIYIIDALFTQKPAEYTEPACADILTRNNVALALFESNNGGRGFARNIERIMKDNDNNRTVVTWQATTANKQSRIRASSYWIKQNLLMPANWTNRWPDLASQILSYVDGGKNPHDDALDAMAGIYEQETKQEVEYFI